MSKGDTFENDLMKLIFQAVAIANLADNAATAPLTSIYVSLHTADPTEGGNQASSEATYGAYARVAVTRTSGFWAVSTNTASNAGAINFPAATSGTNTITHVGIGTAASGTGKLLYSGALSAPLTVNTGITPSFASGQLTISED